MTARVVNGNERLLWVAHSGLQRPGESQLFGTQRTRDSGI
jgi:hypothetical protein